METDGDQGGDRPSPILCVLCARWGQDGVRTLRRVPELRLIWQEQGGPDVQPPEILGFGTTMLSRAIEHQQIGRVELDWRERGWSIVSFCRSRNPRLRGSNSSWN